MGFLQDSPWCAATSCVAVESVRLGGSMSGQEQQVRSVSGVGRHRWDYKHHLEAGTFIFIGEIKFECHKFATTLKFKIELKKHTLLHCNVRTYECLQCRKKLKPSRHTWSHCDLRNYECQEFGKRLTSSTYLNEYIFRHTGLKEFKCEMFQDKK